MKDDEFLISDLTALQKRIGLTVSALREKMGYTNYEDFAREHGFSRDTYWKVEAGKANSTLRTLLRVAIIHGLTFEQLITLVQNGFGETEQSPKK